jgi:hypothetical protein
MHRLHISKSELVSSYASTLERVTVNSWLLQTEEQRRNVPKAWAVQCKMWPRTEEP